MTWPWHREMLDWLPQGVWTSLWNNLCSPWKPLSWGCTDIFQPEILTSFWKIELVHKQHMNFSARMTWMKWHANHEINHESEGAHCAGLVCTSTSTPYAVCTQTRGPPTSYSRSLPDAAPDATMASLQSILRPLPQYTTRCPSGDSFICSTFELRYVTPASLHLPIV